MFTALDLEKMVNSAINTFMQKGGGKADVKKEYKKAADQLNAVIQSGGMDAKTAKIVAAIFGGMMVAGVAFAILQKAKAPAAPKPQEGGAKKRRTRRKRRSSRK